VHLLDEADAGRFRVLLQRIASECDEQPGLRLTAPQAQRLWALDEPTCRSVLVALVDAGVLQRNPDGHFQATAIGRLKAFAPRPTGRPG
jgi:hypothetical protein